jgi:hypothetical protein
MNSTTITKDIIRPVLALVHSSTSVTSKRKICLLDNIVTTTTLLDSKILQKYFRAQSQHSVEDIFYESFFDLEIEDEYTAYLFDFLSNILMGFSGIFVIDTKTKSSLNRFLGEFATQDLQRHEIIMPQDNSSALEWDNYSLIIDFVRFLNHRRVDCHSDLETSELSKLISCLKIFVLNEIIDRIATVD